MPSQADEEAHQLSYLQKHIDNILSLLADSTEGEGDESLVCEFCCIVLPLISVESISLVMLDLEVNGYMVYLRNTLLLILFSFCWVSLQYFLFQIIF